MQQSIVKFELAYPTRRILSGIVAFSVVFGAMVCVAIVFLLTAQHVAKGEVTKQQAITAAYAEKISGFAMREDLNNRILYFKSLVGELDKIKSQHKDLRYYLNFFETHQADGVMLNSLRFNSQKAQLDVELYAIDEKAANQYLRSMEQAAEFKSVTIVKRKSVSRDKDDLTFELRTEL